MTRDQAVRELQATWAVLNADIDEAVAYGRAQNTPYAQRALFRAFFALVEGLSFQLRQITVASLDGIPLLSEEELFLLKERVHRIDESGRPKSADLYLQFPQSLLFSIGTYVKNHGAQFSVETSGNGWQAFKISCAVRNRLMHPKSSDSLAPTNDELQALTEASRWWHATLLAMFRVCDESDEYWRQQLPQDEAT